MFHLQLSLPPLLIYKDSFHLFLKSYFGGKILFCCQASLVFWAFSCIFYLKVSLRTLMLSLFMLYFLSDFLHAFLLTFPARCNSVKIDNFPRIYYIFFSKFSIPIGFYHLFLVFFFFEFLLEYISAIILAFAYISSHCI